MNVSKRIIFETHEGTNKRQTKYEKHKGRGMGEEAKIAWCKQSFQKKRKKQELEFETKKEKKKNEKIDFKALFSHYFCLTLMIIHPQHKNRF